MNGTSSREYIPNPTLLLFLMAVVLVWNLWSDDAGPISAMAASLVLGIVVAGVVYLLSRRPLLAVIALIVSGVMARLSVHLGGMRVRPEYIAAILVCLAVPFWPRQQWPRPRWMLPDLLLVLYIASNLVSSVVMSVEPRQTLRWAMQQALVILPYFLLRLFCTDRERFRKAFMVLLVVGASQAAVGVFCFFSNRIFGSEFGMEMGQYGQYGEIPGTFGVDYEANILGAISAAAFVMMLAAYLKGGRRPLLWGLAITYAGTLIALARSAIIATFIAVVLLLIVGRSARFLDSSRVKAVAGTLLIASLLLFPVVIPLYVDRFSTVDVSDIAEDSNTTGRVIAMVSATDGIIAHPIMGNGTESFQLLVTNEDMGYGDDVDQGSWIGNTELRVLHDTGVVGLTLLVCFLGSLALRSWRTLKKQLQPELLALLLGCVIYAVTFQMTEGTILEFFWVHMGLLGCAVSVYQDRQAPERLVPPQ